MTLVVEVPRSRPAARSYVISTLLGDFLGLEFAIQSADVTSTRITLEGTDQSLEIADELLGISAQRWLKPDSMPQHPWPRARLKDFIDLPAHVHEDTPMIFGARGCRQIVEIASRKVVLNFDLLGCVFFLLTRYEELVGTARDEHDRFPSSASALMRERLTDRPIVNEYVEILWSCLRLLWPALPRRQRQYRFIPSHDVDHPLSVAFMSPLQVLRTSAGDLISRRDAELAVRRLRAAIASRSGNFDVDPCNSFDFIMDQSEARGVASAFYFITGSAGSKLDGKYTMGMPWIEALVRRISARGHEIGLHPSYYTYNDESQLSRETHSLLQAAELCGVRQHAWGGRQHYLRWSVSATWRAYDRAGLAYDSSVGFADATGFRSGCCYEHPTFDLLADRTLSVVERPLVVMEKCLAARLSSAAGREAAVARVSALADICRDYGGDFTFLWHNSKLVSRWERETYAACFAEAAA